MNKILVYTEKITPRIQYVFEFILNEFSGLELSFTDDISFFLASETPKINYSNTMISDEIQLSIDSFLYTEEISTEIRFSELNEVGKIFFALSRYEEYLPQEKDQHGRVSGKGKVYKTPFIDKWILEFQQKLKEKYPQLLFKKRTFELVVTCDVDQTWKYKNKGFKRTCGGFLRDLINVDYSEFSKRIRVIFGDEKDPYDTFDYFKQLKEKYHFQMIFFWLMADYDTFDKNNPVTNTHFQNKIKEVSRWATFGIHPSYASTNQPEKLDLEINRLQNVMNDSIDKSRQHYIKLNLPKTYYNLIQKGITEDYTMAYADETGFRAGTTTPFFWYDLENEAQTNLKVHPFCTMDVSMRNYMGLSINESINEVQRLKSEIQKVNGQMVVLFHNSNLNDDWNGWSEVVESLFK